MTSERTDSILVMLKGLCFLVTILSPAYTFQLFDPCGGTDLLPRDPLVFVGETLRITCTSDAVFKNDISTAQFRFEAQKNKWIHPPENVTDIGSSTAEINVLITENFTSTTSVYCYNGQTPICSTKIYVEYPLRNISNFTGFLFRDRNPYIQVSWSNNSEYYLRPKDISTEAKFLFSQGDLVGWENATLCESSDSCTFPYQGSSKVYFHIKVSYKGPRKRPGQMYLKPLYELEVEKQELFVANDHVKTERVTGVKVSKTNKTSVEVLWTLPFYFTDLCQSFLCPWIIYRMRVQIADLDEERYISVQEGRQDHSKPNEPILVENLTAATSYLLTVWVKHKEMHPWSDPSEPIKLTTAEDRPLSGPVVTPTGYYVVAPCENGQRQVIIYWNTQPESSVRGEISGYEVHVGKDKIKLRAQSNFLEKGFPCAEESEVKIYTLTEVGPSVNSSVIFVPAVDQEQDFAELANIDFKVQEIPLTSSIRKGLNVSWNADSLFRNFGQVDLVFYMCEESQPNTCLNDYKTVKEDLYAGHIFISVESNLNLFGYALESTGGQKTGIDWTNCVFLKNRKPPQPTGLLAGPGEEDRSVRVSWTDKRCDSKSKVLVQTYYLAVCAQRLNVARGQAFSHNKCSSVILPSDKGSSHVFKNQETSEPLKVYLKAESSGGYSPVAETVGKASMENSGKGNDTMTTVMIVLSGLVAAAVLIFMGKGVSLGKTLLEKQITPRRSSSATSKIVYKDAKGHPICVWRRFKRGKAASEKCIQLLDENQKEQKVDTGKGDDSGFSSAANTQPSLGLSLSPLPEDESDHTDSHGPHTRSQCISASGAVEPVKPYVKSVPHVKVISKKDAVEPANFIVFPVSEVPKTSNIPKRDIVPNIPNSSVLDTIISRPAPGAQGYDGVNDYVLSSTNPHRILSTAAPDSDSLSDTAFVGHDLASELSAPSSNLSSGGNSNLQNFQYCGAKVEGYNDSEEVVNPGYKDARFIQ